MIYIILSILVGYMIGCIQPSYLIGKLKKKNIKEVGSKNAGASNVTVVFGWKYGIIVALIDIFKPIISIFLIWLLCRHLVDAETILLLSYINGASVVVGHIFPFFMNFNGGKGTASMIGLFFAVNWKFAFIALIIFVLLTILSNYIVIGAFALNTSFVIYTWMEVFTLQTLLIAIFLLLLFVLKHKDNFYRILNGKETGLRSVVMKKKLDNTKGTTM